MVFTTTTTENPTTTTKKPTTTTQSTTRRSTYSHCKLSPRKFGCSDKTGCLNSSQVCDNKIDCLDNSDETGCPKNCPLCSKYNFKCHKACECISIYWVCDGSADCADQSDELGCPAVTSTPSKPTTETSTTPRTPTPTTHPPCPNNKIYKSCARNCENKCQYLLDDCIETNRNCQQGCGCPKGLVGNGTFCVLLSACSCYDSVSKLYYQAGERWERNCEVCTCFANAMACHKKTCLKPYCPPPKVLKTIPGECCPKCIYGTFPPTTVSSTTIKTCLADEFMCRNNECIPKEWVCDGERDCFHADDERGCMEKPKDCFQAVGKMTVF